MTLNASGTAGPLSPLEPAPLPQSPCVAARMSIASWSPVPGLTQSVTVTVGLCGCDVDDFEFACEVAVNGEVVLHGGLESEEAVKAFANDMNNKLKSTGWTLVDKRSTNIVVPCPPPKPQ
jgi:hypothetical protein